MNEFNQVMKEAYGVELASSFEAHATYLKKMDYVEYLAADAIVVARRIDARLTILLNASRTEIVGFRLKGFAQLFNDHLRTVLELTEEDFVPLVNILLILIKEVGDSLLEKPDRATAYRDAYRLAQSSDVKLVEFPVQEAA